MDPQEKRLERERGFGTDVAQDQINEWEDWCRREQQTKIMTKQVN